MTIKRDGQLKCNKCDEAFDVSVYETIDVTNDPELKIEVFNKKIFDFHCPKCNEFHRINYPCIYKDDTRKIIIFLADDASDLENLNEFGKADDYRKDYTMRIVHDLNELVESALIFEYHLNDKVIGCLKILADSQAPFDKKEILHTYFAGKNENGLHLDIVKTDNTIQHVCIPEIGYEKAYNTAKEAFDVNEHDWLYIDLEYMINFFNQFVIPGLQQK